MILSVELVTPSRLYVFSELLQARPADIFGELAALDLGYAPQNSLSDSLGLGGG